MSFHGVGFAAKKSARATGILICMYCTENPAAMPPKQPTPIEHRLFCRSWHKQALGDKEAICTFL